MEKWKELHHGEYPDEIYLQVDGGSENANQWVLALLLASQNIVWKCFHNISDSTDLTKLLRVYFPVFEQTNTDSWVLIILDLTQLKLYYADPKWSGGRQMQQNPISATAFQQRFAGVHNAFSTFLMSCFNCQLAAEESPTCSIWKHQYYEPQEDNLNSILYLFLIQYFLVVDCPIWFTLANSNQQRTLRQSIVYWIRAGELPF